jgi:hypothetical protein
MPSPVTKPGRAASPNAIATAEPPPPLPAALDGWQPLGSGDTAIWSPDSRMVLIGSAGGADVTVVDESGTTLASYAASAGVWIDNARLMIDAGGSGIEATITSGHLTPAGRIGSHMLSDGLGDVAVTDQTGPQFSVWRDGTWSDPLAGFPVAWSVDGTKLALLHLVGFDVAGPGTNGYLEIIEWPSKRVLWQDESQQYITGSTYVRFDPSGRYVGMLSYHYRVIDLVTGSIVDVATKNFRDNFGWDSNSHIIIGDSKANTISAYDVDGSLVRTWRGRGDTAISTPTGSSQLFFTTEYDQPPPMTIVRGSQTDTFSVDGTSGVLPVLAPDGHAVVLGTYRDNKPLLVAGPP